MVGIILTIILGIIIVLFCIAVCVVSSECEKWEQKCRKEREKRNKNVKY